MTSTRSSSTRRKIDPSKATGTFVARTASSFAMASDRLGTRAEGVSKSKRVPFVGRRGRGTHDCCQRVQQCLSSER